MVIPNCLTFDIEEHFQVSAFDSPLRRRYWDSFESRVEKNTEKILNLLAAEGIRATFFVLGWVAERHPNLVRSIAQLGHEVASHGYAHELITVQTPEEFRDDIRRAKGILEDLTGLPILGYRAPSFTIIEDTLWALRILVQEGYAYDSSIFPISHYRYGIKKANLRCHQISTQVGPIWEVPLSSIDLYFFRLPIAGGGYFRLFPYSLMRELLKRVEANGRPLVMYLHPWELDPSQPKMIGPFLSEFRHYHNLDKTEERLVRLLREFHFVPIREGVRPISELFQGLTGETNFQNFNGPTVRELIRPASFKPLVT